MKKEKLKILLGVTGSVASILTTKLVDALQKEGHEVKVVFTKAGAWFWNFKDLNFEFYTDEDEWKRPYVRGNDILHIELRKWADMLVIAPLSANTLAKLAHGMSDNLLTSIVLAWDREKPIVIAPAMNTNMWENPRAQRNLNDFKDPALGLNVFCQLPVSKTLACGDSGVGAMASVKDIVLATYLAWQNRNRSDCSKKVRMPSFRVTEG